MAVVNLSFYSKILQAETELILILPSGYGKKEKVEKYPTLWLLHGGNADCWEWFSQTSLARYVERRNLAVVLPSIYNSFGMNMKYGARYADYLEQELMPTVRRIFPCLSHEREKNFVGGASMGGFAAFRWAMNCPEKFSCAGSFAGALDMPVIFARYLEGIQPGGPDFLYAFGSLDRMKETENDIFYMAEKNLKKGVAIPRLFMVCGKDDFGYDQNVVARDKLLKAGCNITWKQVPGVHGYDCWDPCVPEFIDWLFVDTLGEGIDSCH